MIRMRPKLPALNDNMRGKVKKVAKYVFGGYPQVNVGKGLKKVGNWMAGQMEKEWRGEDEHIEEFRKKQKERGLIN